ncbi:MULTISPECIES: hemin uptake protein HemP [unclassified Thioalkalivibrio]|uniref:hemin uptake protein HemP n=1 Tax=unclassified Thioalkalivibrio TaxID=2621013 RepID=UPI000361FD0D|nr:MULTISPECIES: hemin uptake protein HemP [unclassified Thioalkalivibrio]
MSSSENRHQPGSVPEHTEQPRAGAGAGAGPEGRPAGVPREIASSELLCDADRLYIRHEGQCYTLRVTSSRKLILTK